MPKPPVIFLAFANDHQNYLYKLTEEQNAIRNAVSQMKKEGLCEVVYETDTDLNKIWRTFNEYQDRIAIFHYGGHAEDYSLLLQRADGQQQLVDGEGLVSFLSRQRGLKLVFINGCSSKRQAEELRDSGIPAVIGTSEPIDDEAATTLSKVFYESLATGRSLQQAWLDASDMLRADQLKKQKGYYRSVGRKSKAKRQQTLNFPWDLYIRPGSEYVQDWNIPTAANNPLFGLDLPKDVYQKLPVAPYIGLHYFREDDAPIFFGRGTQIQELHNHLQGLHPIILFYGRSGVGKSSMLDAGLLPRIKDKFETKWERRSQKKGLLGTLDLVLQNYLRKLNPSTMQVDLPQYSILEKWQEVETRVGKPLLVVLDQVEEMFTLPMPVNDEKQEDELLLFLGATHDLFNTKDGGIKGKLILSYRKEYHADIRDALCSESIALPFTEHYLKPLDRKGIIEAIEGINKDKHSETKKKYRLEIDENLPEIIADDLLEDSESPIATVLQVILHKLWITADGPAAMQDLGKGSVKFKIEEYQALKKEGTTMGDFFQQQMKQLEQKDELKALVQSGLVLDLLKAHTTDMGTAKSNTHADLLERYTLREQRLDNLLKALEQLSLLYKIGTRTTRLTHDTLAPVVTREYNFSDAPAQRAARILKNKMAEMGFRLDPSYLEKLQKADVPGSNAPELNIQYRGPEKYHAALKGSLAKERWQRDQKKILEKHTLFSFGNGESKIYLDNTELGIVEKIFGEQKTGSLEMLQQTSAEKALILQSQEHRKKKRQQQKLLKRLGILAILLIVGTMIFALIKMKEATKSTKEAQAAALAAKSRQQYPEDNTIALNLALAGHQRASNEESRAALADIINNPESNFYIKSFSGHDGPIKSVVFSPDGQSILTASSDKTAKLWASSGELIHTFEGHTGAITKVAFSPDGESILTGSLDDNSAKLWRISGESIKTISFDSFGGDILDMAFAPNGKHILTVGSRNEKKNLAAIWNITTDSTIYFGKDQGISIFTTAFSSTGDTILTVSDYGKHTLWDISGDPALVFRSLIQGNEVVFSPSGGTILTWNNYEDGKTRLWNLSGDTLKVFPEQLSGFSTAAFSPDGRLIVTIGSDTKVKLWDLEGKLLETFSGHTSQIHSVAFSPDGKYIVSGSEDGTAKLWPVSPTFSGMGSVLSIAFAPDGQSILTGGSRDRKARLWSTSGQEVKVFEGHISGIQEVAFSPDGQLIATGGDDNSAKLWNIEGELQTTFLGHRGVVESVAFSPDGQYVLTGSGDGSARLWNITGDSLHTFPVNKGSVNSVAFSPDRESILTGSGGIGRTAMGNRTRPLRGDSSIPDNIVTLWNISGDSIRNFIGHSAPVRSVAFSPDGKSILTGSDDSSAIIWSTSGALLHKFSGHSGGIKSVTFSPDGQSILTGSTDGRARLWSISGSLIQTYAQPAAIYSVAISPDGLTILTGGMNNTLRSWKNFHKELEQEVLWDRIYQFNKEEQRSHGIDWKY